MFVESAIVLAGVGAVAMNLTEDYRSKKREIREIKDKWDMTMDAIGSKVENKISQKYEMLKIITKHYGFDSIISLPMGNGIKDLRNIIPLLENSFGANVVIEISDSKTTAYMRVHYVENEISDKDRIRFCWYRHFFKGDNNRNPFGETYKISNIEEIIKPGEDVEKEIVGYRLSITIPEGLSYDDLIKHEDSLSKTIGNTFIRWNHNLNNVDVEVITSLLSNTEPFDIIKCEPYELYCVMTYSYRPIILDFKTNPFAIIGGQNGTGKSVSEIMPFLNLACQHDESKFRMFIGMTSDKQDLRILSKLPQCYSYSKTLKDTLNLMRYLTNEIATRNKCFDKCKKYTVNIFDYNKKAKDKLPYLYFITDEIADFMEEPQDNKETKAMKSEFMSLFWKLTRTGRSAGVWAVASTQRGDTKNLDANTKSQFGNKICFYQSNISSAQTIFGNGDGLCTRVTNLNKTNRECLVEYSDGIFIAKSLYLSNDMMENLIKDIIVDDKEYLNININGDIVEEKSEKVLENEQKQPENIKKEEIIEEKTKKLSRFEQYQAKKEDKIKKEEERIKYLESVKNEILKNSIKKKGDKNVN